MDEQQDNDQSLLDLLFWPKIGICVAVITAINYKNPSKCKILWQAYKYGLFAAFWPIGIPVFAYMGRCGMCPWEIIN